MLATMYYWCGALTGALVGLVSWGYAITTYGILLGGGLGWIPACVLGFLAFWGWPLAWVWGIGLVVAGALS